jgi:hypothetical protein
MAASQMPDRIIKPWDACFQEPEKAVVSAAADREYETQGRGMVTSVPMRRSLKMTGSPQRRSRLSYCALLKANGTTRDFEEEVRRR